MKRWLKFVEPAGNVAASGDWPALKRLHQVMVEDVKQVIARSPQKLLPSPAAERAADWVTGWPAILSQPMNAMTRRINGLPVDAFIDRQVTHILARIQAHGLRGRALGRGSA